MYDTSFASISGRHFSESDVTMSGIRMIHSYWFKLAWYDLQQFDEEDVSIK